MVAGLAGILLSMGLVNQRINLPIQAGGGLFFLLGLLLILIMPENGFRPTPRQDRNTWQHMAYTFRQGLGMVKRRRALLTILAIGLFYGLYSEAFDRLWVKLLVDNFTLPALGQLRPEAWFAVLRAVGMVLSIAATEVARRKLDAGQVGQIATGLFAVTGALIAGLLVFATAGVLGVAVAAYWLIGVARSVIEPLYTAWVNHRLDSSVRATVLSMSSQVDAIGQIAGGPALGLVGSLVSVRAAIAAAAFVLSPVLWLFTRARRDGEVEMALEQDAVS
jgi:DHA3 family tetracycline resistance protein-like MFS transporter